MFLPEEEMPDILTFEEVREYLYVSRNTLLNMLHSKILKGFKVGNRWRIRKDDLVQFTKKEWWQV